MKNLLLFLVFVPVVTVALIIILLALIKLNVIWCMWASALIGVNYHEFMFLSSMGSIGLALQSLTRAGT